MMNVVLNAEEYCLSWENKKEFQDWSLHHIFARQGEEIKMNNLTQEKVMKTISFGALGSRD